MGSIFTENEACLTALLLCTKQVFPAVLNGAIELNLFEIIGKEKTMVSASEIASKMPTHQQHSELPERLERVLRLLASHSLLNSTTRTNADGRNERIYGLSPVGKYFVSDQENVSNLAPFTSVICSQAMSRVWPNFKDVIIDEDIDLFKKVHGEPFYQFTQRDTTMNQVFNKAMNELCTLDMRSIFQAYTGFEGISTLVDVGGGTGRMLSMITSMYPSMKGINFDLPHVVEKAPTFPGVEHVGGDMYESVPQGDAMMLKAVLHNWSDEKCISLLKNCHKSLPQNGKVIVVDFIVPETSGSDVSKIVSITDNLMFVTVGGRERTKDEFEALAKSSGFSRCEVVCTTFTALAVLELYK
ncbi:hypothetical protein RJT34_26615 [Clitoria ternatea]|uniref:Uncharacterized protein n=1 Tax=Clitoria ternatea TaxID=43366 RepID=A0AAN9IBN4_CLITE